MACVGSGHASRLLLYVLSGPSAKWCPAPRNAWLPSMSMQAVVLKASLLSLLVHIATMLSGYMGSCSHFLGLESRFQKLSPHESMFLENGLTRHGPQLLKWCELKSFRSSTTIFTLLHDSSQLANLKLMILVSCDFV